MSDNPLLQEHELPPFQKIRPQDVEPAIDHILARNREAIADLVEHVEQPTWDTLFLPLEEIEDRLHHAWSPVSHLNSVVSSDELREAHNACLAKISDYATELGQNRELFELYKRYSESPDFALLDEAQRKCIENALRDFRLSGVDLPDAERNRFAEISRRLAELSSRFSDNVLDATGGWTRQIDDEEELAGLPKSALDSARQAAAQRDQEGFLLTLEAPSYVPLMTYCDNRTLRREIYEAYTTRASDQGPNAGRWDNAQVMEEILGLRRELAILVGFANYAELSIATKMAASTDEVMGFLNELSERAAPVAREEYHQLIEFARERFGIANLESWDIAYYSEKLREERFSISQEVLRPYFPVPRVLSGLFEVVDRLYDIEVREVTGWETWHPDVACYELVRRGETIARCYLDLYAREKKQGGAWMDDGRIRRRRLDGSLQLPTAYLVCNFTPPLGEEPALLTHREVVTLFHEFGHGLHHMLTAVDVAAVSGIGGVAWDAVELPSQFHENWCWQPEALEFISGHYQTGESLPEDLLARMFEAKNFNSAIDMVRQLEFGLFDFRLHMEYAGGDYQWLRSLLEDVRQRTEVVPTPPFNRFQNGFSHIFGGGYAAGYYSYKWAEVLSADAFSRFSESGVFNRQTGEQFLATVLERGGSRDAMDLFVEFMGREPQIDALLRQDGIIE